MSRLGVNGTCARPLPNEEQFQFGFLPEDESEGSGGGDEIDAVNDETFGTDLGSVVIDDLEEYAKQTEGLHLDDGTAWMDEPSCSVSAPDPSTLPIPTFAGPSSYNLDNHVLSSPPYQLDLGTVDSLWRNGDSESVWTAPELTSTINRSAFDFINKSDMALGQAPSSNRHESSELSEGDGKHKHRLAAIPKGALTLEEIEGQHISSAQAQAPVQAPVQPTSRPAPPPIPSEGAMTVADLERRLLQESSGEEGVRDQTQGALPSQAPFPFMPFPFMPPLFAHTLRAHLNGHLPELPPGFPAVPPQMRAALMTAMAQGPPPPGALFGQPPPPFRPVQRPPILRPTHPLLPPHVQYPPNQHMNRMPNMYYRHAQSKRAGLPSGKTISDFALDPYAGFMSRKEREWLVKIQSLQCQGCGNPYDDDMYYTVWKQRKLAEQRRALGLKPENADCDVSTPVANPHHYVPPTFKGSLGRPTLPTANYPRQLIDVHSDSVDEEERSNQKRSSQKKLRALLMQLEGIAVLLIECEDRHRQMGSSSPTDTRDQLMSEIKERVDTVLGVLVGQLRNVMVIGKGRQMIARSLRLADAEQRVTLLEALFSNLPLLASKFDAQQLNSSMMGAVHDTLSRVPEEQLAVLMRSIPLDDPAMNALVSDNEFLINVLVSVLLRCARLNYRIAPESGALYTWLQGNEGKCPPAEQTCSRSPLSYGSEEYSILRTWLQSRFTNHPTSMAMRLAHSLPNATNN